MTRITFYKSDDVYYGYEEVGHAGFAEEGNDIVCSAISAMTMLVINAIEVVYASGVDYTIDDESAKIVLIAKGALSAYEKDEKKRYAVSGLMKAYYLQLLDLVEEYYDYLSVDVVERPLEK